VDFILIIVSLSSIIDSGHLTAPGKEINADQTTRPFDDLSSTKALLSQFLVKLVVESFVLNKPYPIVSSLYVKKILRKRTVSEISIMLPNYRIYKLRSFCPIGLCSGQKPTPRVEAAKRPEPWAENEKGISPEGAMQKTCSGLSGLIVILL